MEYMPVYLPEPPETLAERHARYPLTEIDAAQVLAQVLEGLKLLHANDIIHGSLYPGSIRIKRTDTWSISLSDIGLHSYVDLENSQERGFYASQPTPSIFEPMPKHDTWSVGIVGLYLILPGGLPPRPKHFPYDQSAWMAFMAARARSYHASRPRGKQDASLFLTRVLKYDYRERLTAEECLQDRWIQLWHLPFPDSLDPSDPFFDIADIDSPLETINEVMNYQGSGKDLETEDPGTVTWKGKQPQRSRDMRVTPSSDSYGQGTAIPQSVKHPGVIPTHSHHTRVTRSSSSNKQRSPTPQSLAHSGVTPTKPRSRNSKVSESINRQCPATLSDSAIHGEHTPESSRGRARPHEVRNAAGQMAHEKHTAADGA